MKSAKLKLAVAGGFLLFSSLGLAAQVNEYPWYFYPNDITKMWKIFEKRGKGVVVDILDSKIQFTSILKGKEYIHPTHDLKSTEDSCNFASTLASDNTVQELATLHGTAMAALIAGDQARLSCNPASLKDCDPDGKAAIAGIAPGAKLIGRTWYPGGKLYDEIVSAINEEIPNTSYGKPREKVVRNAKLIAINISGGQKDSDIIDVLKRKASIRQDGDGNPYFLVMAAVGNDGVEPNGENSAREGNYPRRHSSEKVYGT